MEFVRSLALVLVCTTVAVSTNAQEVSAIPDISAFLMPEAREIALAKSAAPAKISDLATILVLKKDGYETVIEGGPDHPYTAIMIMRDGVNPVYQE